jgi:hypothetical protein
VICDGCEKWTCFRSTPVEDGSSPGSDHLRADFDFDWVARNGMGEGSCGEA